MEKNNWDEQEHNEGGSEGHEDDQYKDKFDPNSNEVIVKGLSFKAEGEDVREFFSQFGDIENVNIERRYNGDSKGSCFIKFATKEGLDNAIAADGIEFLGRQVWITRTRAKSDRVKDFGPKKPYRGSGGYGSRGGYRSNNDEGYSDRPKPYVRRGSQGGRGQGRGGHGQGRGGYRNDRNEDRDYDNKREGYGGRGSYVPRGQSSRGGRGGYKKPREEVEQSKILFVGNLNYRSEKDEIWEFFDTKGKVVDVRIARNPAGTVSLFSRR